MALISDRTIWMRLPFFVWSQLVTGFLLLLAFPPLEAAGVMQLMDRLGGSSFFLPTGLVVASQSQRSQHQNRAAAMKLLLSRIYAQRVDAQKAEMERFYGDKGSISWGNQIRSYVFQPYRMVKDLRTGVETSNVPAVMDGDLDQFVNGWLRAGCPIKRMQGVRDEEE